MREWSDLRPDSQLLASNSDEIAAFPGGFALPLASRLLCRASRALLLLLWPASQRGPRCTALGCCPFKLRTTSVLHCSPSANVASDSLHVVAFVCQALIVHFRPNVIALTRKNTPCVTRITFPTSHRTRHHIGRKRAALTALGDALRWPWARPNPSTRPSARLADLGRP